MVNQQLPTSDLALTRAARPVGDPTTPPGQPPCTSTRYCDHILTQTRMRAPLSLQVFFLQLIIRAFAGSLRRTCRGNIVQAVMGGLKDDKGGPVAPAMRATRLRTLTCMPLPQCSSLFAQRPSPLDPWLARFAGALPVHVPEINGAPVCLGRGRAEMASVRAGNVRSVGLG